MKIQRIQAKNFKGFEDLDINLEGKSTVIFGINGTGKSSVLSIVNYTFWNWVNRLNPAQGTSFRTFTQDMVSFGTSKMELSTELELDSEVFCLSRTYTKPKMGKPAVSNVSKKEYDRIVGYYQKNYLDEKADMPVFVNYSTNRSVIDIPLRIRNKHAFSKITALERADEKELDFRTFFEWYRNQEDIENELKIEKNDTLYQDKFLKSVRTAVEAMLGNQYSDLKVKRSPLCLKVKKGNKDIRVDQLSDGEKCTIALFGDLARRIALANPNKENPLEGEGIVLIDEIELHLHPSWQRRVLNVLKTTFPNIQFIITTHSPQVLGEADDTYNVLRLYVNDHDKLIICKNPLYGKDSNGILKRMDTLERPETMKIMFNKFYEYIDLKKFDMAENLLKDIEEKIGEDDPELVSCWIKLDLEQI
jgi:predicted ATP-binding protein involved in virulence